MRDDQLRVMWREAGGTFHGPNVEHGLMEEGRLLDFLRRLTDRQQRLEQALQPFATYYDLNDCHKRKATDALEVPIMDLREAKDALKTAMGKNDG